MDVVEYDLEREDYDSHYEGHPRSLKLTVNYELLPVGPGEVVFGDLSFGHLLAEPWGPGEFEAWADRWKQLVLGTFDNAFELEVYTGRCIVGTSRFEGTLERSASGAKRAGVGYLYEAATARSWALARDPNNAEIVACRLELNPAAGADARVHLRARVAKGRSTSRPSHTPYHGHGASLPAGGTSADVDMILLSGDLEASGGGSSGQAQTRALNEFGRYLGCWALNPGERDLLSSGNQLRPWHGWPWWRRFAEHVDARRRDIGAGTTVFASVVVVRLVSTGERTRRAELESATERPEDQQQALLRDQSPDIDADQVIVGVLVGVMVGGLLAALIGGGYAIGVAIDEGRI